MPKMKIVLLCASALVALTCIGYFLLPHFSSVHTVVYNGNSFRPSELTIKKGETVIFKNKSNEAFWPASNLHPSHLVFSEFDPKEPVKAGDSWSFTFTKEGNWGFHDHIRPTVKGTIHVLTQDGAKVEALDCSLHENKQQCWENNIIVALDEGGVDGAFTVFTDLYESDQEFANSCHSFVHLIGDRSYEQFVNKESFTLTPKMQFCGYGFFHGFMETLLIQSGDIELSREFCMYVDEKLTGDIPSAWKACYHGIGHGALDGGDPRTWGDPVALTRPGLELCLKVGETDFEKHLCGTGVFNGIALAYENGDYGLVEDKEHIFDLCEALENTLFKNGCYDQMNTLIYALADRDIKTALELIDTMKEREYYMDALGSLTSTFGSPDMTQDDYDEVIELCMALPQPSSGACIGGFVTGLIEYGPPNQEYVLGLQFCKSGSIVSPEKEECFESVVRNSSFIFSQTEVDSICELVAKETDISAIEHCTNPA